MSDSQGTSSGDLYAQYLAERDEILRHKWLESEKAGRDIGFEQALVDWVRNHREEWRRTRGAGSRGAGSGGTGARVGD